MRPRLGVNIDHLATLRQLRGTSYPDLIEALTIVEKAGADQITVHLREDRRHIQPQDVKELRARINILLNLEMAATESMVRFAQKIKPDIICLVPEKRQELTTEGGLNLAKNYKKISQTIQALKKSKIKVSLFVEPTLNSIKLSHALGADAVELHTGSFALASRASLKKEIFRIHSAVNTATQLGLRVHAGHGLDYKNIRLLLAEPGIEEYNIGHSIVCRAAMVGLERAVREMISALRAP